MAANPSAQTFGVKFLPVLIAIALVSVTAAAVLYFFSTRDSTAGADQVRQVNEFVALSQKIPAQATSALSGNTEAFNTLATTRQQFGRVAAAMGPEAVNLNASTELLKHTQTILGARESALAVQKASTEISPTLQQLLQGLGNVVGALGADNVEAMTRHLERFEMTGLRLQQDIEALKGGVGDTKQIAQRLADGVDYMNQVIGGLSGQDAVLGLPLVDSADGQARLKQITALFGQLSASVRSAISSADSIRAAREANTALAASAEQIFAHYQNALGMVGGARDVLASKAVIGGLFGIALLSLVLLAVLQKSSGNLRKSLELQSNKNERNQEAILRLLDELSSLADGDLTVQATVTEDITGAIADSINYAIEALRELVATINDSAITLDGAVKQTQSSAGHLAKASVAQSKQIALASESVAAMAASTEEVSGNAERSSDVARHSVDVAHKGGDAVRRTIDGMNAIRETIQETSKRIKRLGESSQEIGNIVELINDIAEQTNILALNASIQASMAGEAGRGFAVVADEVQRLAERAATATKQIEVLVRTIQADTNEAVVSMERSTTDVVGGALLAENAGAALEEIEQVSNQIASLVQNISASARQQASAAQNISRNMQVLREISSQAAENSASTSNSVGKLAELSSGLRKSVAGFRLPNAASGKTELLTDPGRMAAQPPPASTPQPAPKKVSGLAG